MSIIFRAGNPNFPANQTELDERLAEIEELIDNLKKVPLVNINFVEKAFKLLEDCDLLTEENLKFLCSASACQSYDFRLKFIRNYNEGVLRRVEDDNDVYTDGWPRFYPGFDRKIEVGGQKYLIVNDWYKDGSACPNKRPFYNWLKEKTQAACEKYWKIPPRPPRQEPTEIDYLKAIYRQVKALNDKVDALNERLDNIDARIEDLEKEAKKISDMWEI